MRLGGQVFPERKEPELWAADHAKMGYRAAVFPVRHDAGDDVIDAYARAAREAGLVIAEVGAWSNPISPDEKVRREAIEYCKNQLALADRVGARCCVNIAGSRNVEKWDGPHPDNFSDETFELIVETTREIIDAVNPTRTTFALETMPWVFPDTADSYLALIKAIDRKAISVHFDPVNMISSPRVYFRNGEMIRDFVKKLGAYITNCHAKDIRLDTRLTVHLEEVLPGTGALDYRVFLSEIAKLDPDTPMIVEHLKTEEEYRQASDYIRQTAAELGIAL
ncbi:MAG: xylose isomerase [Thermobacillus sp.]|uniref:sugar phosphate isomerase/epimerase family protein n=1 Tax=Thermobacillus sp. TaxID=2108467 RepID=UPI000E3B0F75|nr:sugar phosphate isomerase/epimerase family protein [Thermobacillus sp.]REK57304.1 MAG: xylose isomerase [Thermobacillus sp.]